MIACPSPTEAAEDLQPDQLAAARQRSLQPAGIGMRAGARPAIRLGPQLILLNKPYGVVCQFSPHRTRPTLKEYVTVPGVYPAGRLDWDSEGLVVLTGDGRLQHRIAQPGTGWAKTYWIQVEGIPSEIALQRLRRGVDLGDFVTRPAQVRRVEEPLGIWPRKPAIRVRAAIPVSWLEVTLKEGKNRQIRRMTAAVGHPTLRLIRWAIGPWDLAGLPPGCSRVAEVGSTQGP